MKYQNNPLNITCRNFKFVQTVVGCVGWDGNFCRFASVMYCVRVFLAILRKYSMRNINTISGIITEWCPPDESSTSAYVSYVCDKMSVHRGYVISVFRPMDLFKFISAMCMYESGYVLYQSLFDDAYEEFVKSRRDLFE